MDNLDVSSDGYRCIHFFKIYENVFSCNQIDSAFTDDLFAYLAYGNFSDSLQKQTKTSLA